MRPHHNASSTIDQPSADHAVTDTNVKAEFAQNSTTTALSVKQLGPVAQNSFATESSVAPVMPLLADMGQRLSIYHDGTTAEPQSITGFGSMAGQKRPFGDDSNSEEN